MDDSSRDMWTQTILFVLDLLQQIADSEGRAPEPAAFRETLELQLSRWSTGPSTSHTNHLIQQALVYWCDEVLIDSAWDYSQEWSSETLEQRFFGTRGRAWRFYAGARQARRRTDLAAFEVFAVTASLGFRGVYRNSPESVEIPGSAEADAEELSECVTATANEQAVPAHSADASLVLETVPPCEKDDADYVPTGSLPAKMPATFQEWVKEAYSLLVNDRFPPFEPNSPLGAAQSARPLWGTRALWIWSMLLLGGVLAAAMINLWLGG